MPPSLKHKILGLIFLLLVSIPLAKQLENGAIEGSNPARIKSVLVEPGQSMPMTMRR